MCYTKANLTILGGTFRGNVATAAGEATGGAIFGATGAGITIAGGLFEENEAKDGGVVYVFSGAALAVEGGEFSGNVAANSGGGISVTGNGDVEVGWMCIMIAARLPWASRKMTEKIFIADKI